MPPLPSAMVTLLTVRVLLLPTFLSAKANVAADTVSLSTPNNAVKTFKSAELAV